MPGTWGAEMCPEVTPQPGEPVLDPDELRTRAEQGRLRELAGIGDTTARVITESLAGGTPSYLERHGRPRHPCELIEHECFGYVLSTRSSWSFAIDGDVNPGMEMPISATSDT